MSRRRAWADPDAPVPDDGPVAVGLDGSPADDAALAFAFPTADVKGQTSWRPTCGAAASSRRCRPSAGRMAREVPDLRVKRVVTGNRPARVLLEQSGHARLLVMGSRGQISAGSVCNAVLQHARCPVAVVHPRGSRVGAMNSSGRPR
jgi:hypothetical protein